MTLNPEHYEVQIPYIKSWIASKDPFVFLDEVGLIAVASGCHIVMVSYLIGKLIGFNDEIRGKIKRDMIFHHVERIEGYDNT